MNTQQLTIEEQERAAYMAGDIERAALLARIDDLQRALGEAVAENEELREYCRFLDSQIEDLLEARHD